MPKIAKPLFLYGGGLSQILNSTSCLASDTSEEDEPVPKWDDPDKVPWYFLKTGKSKVEGILVTHDSNFKVAVEYVDTVLLR